MTKTADNNKDMQMRIADALCRLADCAEQQTGMPQHRIVQTLADGGGFFHWRAAQAGGVLTAAMAGKTDKAEQLRGLQSQTAAVRDNTARFMDGKPAHNVLLSGARGCGKSSVIRAVLAGFAAKGLKVVETDGDGLAKLAFLMAAIAKTKHSVIIFCDDLSFETDPPPAAVRSALEGSFFADARVLIYATANRRHLSRSRFSDADDIHPDETEDEQLALADRFGLSLRIYAPEAEEYDAIVADWLRRFGVKSSPSFLRMARAFADRRGGRSGRMAKQFALLTAAEK